MNVAALYVVVIQFIPTSEELLSREWRWYEPSSPPSTPATTFQCLHHPDPPHPLCNIICAGTPTKLIWLQIFIATFYRMYICPRSSLMGGVPPA